MPASAAEGRGAGLTEACLYNDHERCNGAGGKCRCSCHNPRSATVEATATGAGVDPATASPLQLKSCPRCQVKRPAVERYCRSCGTKLGSLACPGCNSIAEPSDSYCWQCGCPLSKQAAEELVRSQPAAPAAPQPPLATVIAEERNVLADIQAAEASGLLDTKQVDEVPAEQSWQLPQGTFKTTTRKPVAGRVRQTKVPFSPQ